MKRTLFIGTALAVTAYVVTAQTGTNAPPAPVATPLALPPDLVTAWHGLVVLFTPVLVAGIKKAFPTTPKVAWPLIAVVIGSAADWLLHQTGATAHASLALGALCGGSGVALREMSRQVVAMTGMAGDDKPAPAPPPAVPSS